MDYILDESTIDKLIEPYFDKKFADCELDTREYSDDIWEGFFKEENGELILVVGTTMYGGNTTWFSNGHYFSDGPPLFSLEPKPFHSAMLRYINKKHPELSIKFIW